MQMFPWALVLGSTAALNTSTECRTPRAREYDHPSTLSEPHPAPKRLDANTAYGHSGQREAIVFAAPDWARVSACRPRMSNLMRSRGTSRSVLLMVPTSGHCHDGPCVRDCTDPATRPAACDAGEPGMQLLESATALPSSFPASWPPAKANFVLWLAAQTTYEFAWFLDGDALFTGPWWTLFDQVPLSLSLSLSLSRSLALSLFSSLLFSSLSLSLSSLSLSLLFPPSAPLP